MPIERHWVMPEKVIYWTLQNNCTEKWKSKYNDLGYTVSHCPLITLSVNENINNISNLLPNYDALIVSSQFSAHQIAMTLEDKKCSIFTVGNRGAALLEDAGHDILYIAENSDTLATYLKSYTPLRILNLCSDRSDMRIWPENVTCFPFYGPKVNPDFHLTNDDFVKKSIIAFGSPSGVDVWFTFDLDISDSTIATIGKTTANRFTSYLNNEVITPDISTIEHLCEVIYTHLEQTEYEKTK